MASRQVLRVLSRLRVDGVWKEFYVDVPGGARARLHLGPDKNPRQIRTEILLRRCRAAISEAHPTLRLFGDRERGVLSIGWDKILRIEAAPGDRPSQLWWDAAALRKHNLVKDDLAQITNAVVAPQQAEPQWCL